MQKPRTKIGGIRITVPSWVCSGMYQSATTETSAMATAPSSAVVCQRSAVAEIVTGTRISRANGLCSPPVSASSQESCAMSMSSITATCFSVIRLFLG